MKPTAAGTQNLTNTATVSRMYGNPELDTANNSVTVTSRVSEAYTPLPGCDSISACPNTTLTEQPRKFSNNVTPGFAFTASEADSTFECKLDGGAFQLCSLPEQYYFAISEGQHTFQVRAKNADGVVAMAEPNPGETNCELYDVTNDRYIVSRSSVCSSPFTFGGELPDALYYLALYTYDKVGHPGEVSNLLEVDTAAPKFVSGKPTGKRVSPNADVAVTFDDDVYASAKFVNSYKRGSNTPLAVFRENYTSKQIRISPKSSLKRDTWYTAKVTTGVNDGANDLEAPKIWSFKTR